MAKDIYHAHVVEALSEDGWTITHDPLYLSFLGKKQYVDLGAERNLVSAEKGLVKIAVEIKSFLSDSPLNDLQQAVGQYNLYRDVLAATEPDRVLYLAITVDVFDSLFAGEFGAFVIDRQKLRLVVFDDLTRRISQWIP